MTDFFSTNSFDLAVYACLFVAVVMGFMTGLLRSLATIIGYICGAGIAVAATPKTLSLLAQRSVRFASACSQSCWCLSLIA